MTEFFTKQIFTLRFREVYSIPEKSYIIHTLRDDLKILLTTILFEEVAEVFENIFHQNDETVLCFYFCNSFHFTF